MIKPLDDRIVVELPNPNELGNTKTFIQLLKHHEKVAFSKVVAVGPGKMLDNGKFIPMEYTVGDIVYYPAECETTAPKVKLNGQEYLMIVQPQVLCHIPAPVETE